MTSLWAIAHTLSLSVSIAAATEPQPSLVIHNASQSPVECWVEDTFVARLEPAASAEWPLASLTLDPDDSGVSFTGISVVGDAYRTGSIVLPVSAMQADRLLMVWGTLSAPTSAEAAKKPARVEPQHDALFASLWPALRQRHGGHPLTFHQSLVGSKQQDKLVEAGALAVHAGTHSYFRNSAGILFARIPAGEFTVASHPVGRQRSTVTLSSDFYMAVTETTAAQFALAQNQSLDEIGDGADLPAVNMTWQAAADWCGSLPEVEGWRYALPTEAQWEYSCQAGKLRPYAPTVPNNANIMWFSGNSGNRLHPVAQLMPNEYGLFDMHGNVREWCRDWFAPRKPPSGVDPTGPSSGVFAMGRVRRGGAYDTPTNYCTSGLRDSGEPDIPAPWQGFRAVMEPLYPKPSEQPPQDSD